jgi:hypothetical protein
VFTAVVSKPCIKNAMATINATECDLLNFILWQNMCKGNF